MSGLSEAARAFLQATTQHTDTRYAAVPKFDVLDISTIVLGANGAPERALATIDGAGSFTVAIRGRALSERDRILGRRVGGMVGAEYEFVELLASENPGGGYELVDANVPAPTFAAPGTSTTLGVSGGAILATMMARIVPIAEDYGPSGYIVSWRPTGSGQWSDVFVPHIAGATVLEGQISNSLLPGQSVDIMLATQVARARRLSPYTLAQTFLAAGDTGSPATLTSFAVSNAPPGLLVITPTASSIDPQLFLEWEYSIATSAAGAGAVVYTSRGPLSFGGTYGASYYIAVRARAKNGATGNRVPASPVAWDGPYTVPDHTDILDTVPPASMGAPTLASRIVQYADNSWHAYLTVTRPAYTPPSDIAAYEISIVGTDGQKYVVEIPHPETVWDGDVGFGSFDVAMRGRDVAGNRPAFGTTSAIVIAAPALSNTAPTTGTSSVGMGIKVEWNRITGALSYEVQRATDAIGTGATTIATVDSLWYFDPLTSDTLVLPQYWYRVRAVSVQNGSVIQGTYSAWQSGTVGAVDALNLRLLSITAALIATDAITANKILAGAVTAAKLEADLILATKIRTGTSGSRFEIEGHTLGGNQDQIRAYEFSTGADRLRWVLGYAGTTFYTDAGLVRALLTKDGITVNRDTGANRMILDKDGMRLFNDAAVLRAALDKDGLSLYNDAGAVRTVVNKDGLFISNDSAVNRVILAPYASGALQILTNDLPLFLGDSIAGGLSIGHAFLSASKKPHIALSSNFLYFSGAGNGGTMSGEWYRLQHDGGIGWGVGAQHYVTLLRANDRFGNADTMHLVKNGGNKARLVTGDMHSIRSTNAAHGILWLGDGSGGDRYLLWNGSNYIMPGAQATINGVNVGSARSTKHGIEDARIDTARAMQLRPRRFRFTGEDHTTPERIGFVAEEVAEAIPEIAIDLSQSIGHDGKPVFGGKGYSLEGLVAAQQSMIARLAGQLAALTAKVDTLQRAGR